MHDVNFVKDLEQFNLTRSAILAVDSQLENLDYRNQYENLVSDFCKKYPEAKDELQLITPPAIEHYKEPIKKRSIWKSAKSMLISKYSKKVELNELQGQIDDLKNRLENIEALLKIHMD